MHSLIKKNYTQDLIERRTNKKVIDCKWIYKIKEGIQVQNHKDLKPDL